MAAAAPASAAAAAAPGAVADPNATVQYLAIGSMINNVSLSLREINPSVSRPAVLHDFELQFLGELGMGTVMEKAGAHLHGVVHTVTAREMAILDKIEGGYDRLPVTVKYYDGSTGTATAYKFKAVFLEAARKLTKPPTERYLDIITRGCVHYGVAKEWVDHLKTVVVQPRKKPEEMKAYPDPTPATPVMAVAELVKGDGKEGRPLLVAVNAKVLKFVADEKDARLPLTYVQSNLAGKDVTLYMARNLYEPLFPLATTEAELAAGNRERIEDQMYSMWGDQWAMVAVLPPEEPATIASNAYRAARAKAKSAAAAAPAGSAAVAVSVAAPAAGAAK